MSERYRRGWTFGEAAARIAVALGCLCAGGCSLSSSSTEAQVDATGSIKRDAVTTLSADLGAEDWRRAKGALATALDPQGNGAPVKWDNPDSEISGTFTPVAQPFVKSDEICRVFLATINFPGRTSSLQGTACKLSADEWQLKDVKPWKKPN
ncbi:RT0821/Lpp0805 family surface protein [Enterovirga sp.]|uniref:RT0821/Lpp0805 family surface protein n=1 Tax=Enterovirga sp. TaxID=2026350 RepID=UPI002D0A5753|nr:RT0821/Lpp0805 family surface protein [Enterovirga sp.]HMO29971.1 RT0821/Lpp0805 family surface protein [Enterovirga sp.]